jgi:hypothetical protein
LRAAALRRGFDLLEDAVERGAIVEAAISDYRGDFSRVVNILQRIGCEQNQVRDPARFH